MENSDISNRAALKTICNRLVLKSPTAVGMAMIELDCGCINVCGVSIQGAPVGSIKTVALTEGTQNPVCNLCLLEKGRVAGRVVDRKIIWPGDESELPAPELRLTIGRKVFGPEYTE